ncbi:protein of unknown function DUF4378 [Dillenia turbinata]|uniref:DUF4378 domain-containing protein n=1 Tax=Dillenia turbinata TaxID=194707 RepID=A0AAN8UMM4_9MAGN
MGDLNVDEFVNKDMSTSHGRWLDFESEAFEEGTGIEGSRLNNLVDEVVVDFLFQSPLQISMPSSNASNRQAFNHFKAWTGLRQLARTRIFRSCKIERDVEECHIYRFYPLPLLLYNSRSE